MERLSPPKELDGMPPFFEANVYYASSIYDMKRSRDEILSDVLAEQEEYLSLGWDHKLAWILSKLANDLARPIDRDMISAFPAAAIELPPVRHFPSEDPQNKANTISVHDLTGKMDIEFLTGRNKDLISNESLKNNPRGFKNSSWSGAITILHVFHDRGRDRTFLMDVSQTIQKEKSPQKLKAFNPFNA